MQTIGVILALGCAVTGVADALAGIWWAAALMAACVGVNLWTASRVLA